MKLSTALRYRLNQDDKPANLYTMAKLDSAKYVARQTTIAKMSPHYKHSLEVKC